MRIRARGFWLIGRHPTTVWPLQTLAEAARMNGAVSRLAPPTDRDWNRVRNVALLGKLEFMLSARSIMSVAAAP